MTVHAKNNPVGIDLELLRLQNQIEAVGWDNIDVYGKIYINNDGKNKKAEAYISSGEYKEVFVDDTKNAVFGFFVDENRQNLTMIKCKVKLVCSCRLDKLFDSTERMDEEAMLTILEIIRPNILLPSQGGIQTGLSNVFSEVSYDRFKFRDLQPYFNFSISFDIVYKNNVYKILN